MGIATLVKNIIKISVTRLPVNGWKQVRRKTNRGGMSVPQNGTDQDKNTVRATDFAAAIAFVSYGLKHIVLKE